MKGIDSKTGKDWKIRISKALRLSIDASNIKGEPIYIVNIYGSTFSKKGFNNRFAQWAKQADLPDRCRAHGLRKANMRRLADAGASQQQLKAMSNHTNDSEVANYMAEANKNKMADQGIDLLEEYY